MNKKQTKLFQKETFPLSFFTDKTVKNNFLLIKIHDYLKLSQEKKQKYIEIFIDPGVYELTKNDSYSWEDSLIIQDFLDSLPGNHFFSADYPPDMLNARLGKLNLDGHIAKKLKVELIEDLDFKQLETLFLRKSYENALKYGKHENYIVTVQSKFNNILNFKEWFDIYNNLEIRSGIMGMGNFCRIFHITDFIKQAFNYAFKNCLHPRIHIYGLALRLIPYAWDLSNKYGIKLSIDSTKWTRAVTTDLKKKYGVSARKGLRQIYFNEYIKIIKKKGVDIYE